MADLANLKIAVDSRDVKSATDDLNRLGGAASNTERQTSGLGAGLGKLKTVLGGLGIALVVREVFQLATAFTQLADTYSSMNAQLKLVTQSTAQLNEVQQSLFQISQSNRVGFQSTVELYARIARSTESLGVSQKDTLRVTDTINKALVISGTTAEQASGSLLQLGQAFASGTLRGDELNSILEGMPRVARAIADGMGITVGQLRALGAEGKLTSEAVFNALLKMGKDIDTEFGRMPVTVGQATTALSNSLLNIVGKFDEGAGASGSLAEAIMELSRSIDAAAGSVRDFGEEVGQAIQWTQDLGSGIEDLTAGFSSFVTVDFEGFFAGLRNQAMTTYPFLTMLIGLLDNIASRGRSQRVTNEVGLGEGSAMKSLGDIMAQSGVSAEKAARSFSTVGKEAKSAAKKMSEAEKETARLKKQTDDFIKSLESEIDKIGKTDKQLRELRTAKALDAAQTQDQIDKIKEYSAELERLIGIQEAAAAATKNIEKAQQAEKESAEAVADIQKRNRELEHQIKLIGLSGNAREEAVRAFEDETFAAEMAAEGIHRGNEALEEYLRLRRELAQGESVFNKEAEAANRVANNLEAVAGMLGQGRGASVLQNALRMEFEVGKGDNKKTQKLSQILGKELDKIADGFGEKLGEAFAGAQVGQQIDGIFKALGVKSSKAGAQVGGAIGGAFFGPLGAIGGSVIGGLLGGMLKKTPRAAATIEIAGGNALMSGVTGTNSKLRGVATGLANGLIKGLTAVAEALGGALGGATTLSIGQRKNKFTVDVTGRGRTKGVPTFATEAEAIAYAMQYAISQGAITGISAGAQALIRGSGDLNEQLQKALSFENVFKELAREKEPLTFALDELDREFKKLEAIFREAGAGAAEYAQLQELFAIRRQRAIAEAERPAREKEIELLELQGLAVEALAARRKLELDNMDASLRGIQEMIYAQQDINALREAEADRLALQAELLAERQALEAELLDATGNTNEALAMRRMLELEATDASLRGIKSQIFAAQDAAEAEAKRVEAIRSAQDTLRQSYEREADTLRETASRFRQLGSSLRSVSGEIAALIGGGGAASGDLRSRFFSAARSARVGNVEALESLPDLARELAQQVVQDAPDRLSMIRELAAIKQETDAAGAVSERQANVAERQLASLDSQVSQLIDLNETMVSVDSAIKQLVALSGGRVSSATSTNGEALPVGIGTNQVPIFSSNDNMREEVTSLRNEMKIALFQIAKNTGKTSDQLTRWDGEGLPEARGY